MHEALNTQIYALISSAANTNANEEKVSSGNAGGLKVISGAKISAAKR